MGLISGVIKKDLYRYVGEYSFKRLISTYFFIPGFRYMFWFRKAQNNPSNLIYKLIHRRLSYKFGIQIPIKTKIGKGFYIGHYNCIVINQNAIIGNNVNISHGVTIGQVNIGEKEGAPSIGNNVYIGPGAKIIGNIRIGNNVAIGANAVVTADLEDNSVAVGIPAKVISMKGSIGYVNKTV